MFPVMRIRMLRAIALVIVMLVAIPVVDAVSRVVSAADDDYGGEGLSIGLLTGADDAYAALDQIEESVGSAGSSTVSPEFADEIGLLPDARDVRSSDEGLVVGYVVPGRSGEAIAKITENMESGGWTSVPLGQVDGATFLKSGGSFTWAIVTCTEVGSSTSVVVRCMS